MQDERETVITHLQVMHTWASFALGKEVQFFDEAHLKDIADWTTEALNLIEGRTESMNCPKCGEEGYHKVMQTFTLPDMIRRRRKCLKCGKIFYTEERTV